VGNGGALTLPVGPSPSSPAGTVPASALATLKGAPPDAPLTKSDGAPLRVWDPGYVNTVPCRSAISYIDGARGVLRYRGVPIEVLVERPGALDLGAGAQPPRGSRHGAGGRETPRLGASFEETAFLLLQGRLPRRDPGAMSGVPCSGELSRFCEALARRSAPPRASAAVARALPAGACHPMSALISCLAAGSADHPEGNPAVAGGKCLDAPAARLEAALGVLGAAPALAALCYRFSTAADPGATPGGGLQRLNSTPPDRGSVRRGFVAARAGLGGAAQGGGGGGGDPFDFGLGGGEGAGGADDYRGGTGTAGADRFAGSGSHPPLAAQPYSTARRFLQLIDGGGDPSYAPHPAHVDALDIMFSLHGRSIGTVHNGGGGRGGGVSRARAPSWGTSQPVPSRCRPLRSHPPRFLSPLPFLPAAEHELNCSTSAARHIGSSGACLWTSMAAAAAALAGPLHGGANEAVLVQLLALEADAARRRAADSSLSTDKAADDAVADLVARAKSGKTRLSGFGHRVYKSYDPRAKVIKRVADRVALLAGPDPLADVARRLERVALRDPYFVRRGLYPNVDFYSGLVYRGLGFAPRFFTVLFALPRLVGWTCHWLEERTDPSSRIARPQQAYVGPWLRGTREEAEADWTTGPTDFAHGGAGEPRPAPGSGGPGAPGMAGGGAFAGPGAGGVDLSRGGPGDAEDKEWARRQSGGRG